MPKRLNNRFGKFVYGHLKLRFGHFILVLEVELFLCVFFIVVQVVFKLVNQNFWPHDDGGIHGLQVFCQCAQVLLQLIVGSVVLAVFVVGRPKIAHIGTGMCFAGITHPYFYAGFEWCGLLGTILGDEK